MENGNEADQTNSVLVQQTIPLLNSKHLKLLHKTYLRDKS